MCYNDVNYISKNSGGTNHYTSIVTNDWSEKYRSNASRYIALIYVYMWQFKHDTINDVAKTKLLNNEIYKAALSRLK